MLQTTFGAGALFLLLGLGMLSLGIWLMRQAKPKFAVHLTTAAGEQQAVSSSDEMLIRRIVQSLQAAIVARG